MLAARPGLTLTAAVAGAGAMLPTAVMSLVVGAAIDTSIAAGRLADLAGWIALVLGLAVVQAVASGVLNWASHTMWIHGAVSAERAVVGHAAHLGATLPKRLSTGEVVAMGSEDVYDIGNAVETFGRTIGALTSFAVVAVVLVTITPVLGVIALVGVPLAVLGIGPLLRPLHRRKEAQRERFSEVTSMGADIVAGLRILRGVGGERQHLRRFAAVNDRVRDAGVAVGRTESWLAAAEIALPGLVTVVVTWLGARLALDGAISPGELIAFYGASAFLVVPVRTATEAADAASAARVAAGRIDRLLRLAPEFGEPVEPVPLPDGPLSLAEGGLVAPAGRLTVLPPDRALAERLTGYADSDALLGGVPINGVDRAELRRRVVLVLGDDHLFAGRVGEELAAGDAVPVADAIAAADASDVIDALPEGYDAVLSERGRSVSGGQRQRLLLARALTLDPDVLVLEEPTSAVDAHTEARIVERVAALREGRTTVVLTSSPLWRNAPGARVATPDSTHLATPREGVVP
ncbi:ABC transporter transmembrane domain-containing protein [Haloechinothrix halophila]|uniref:ABC transporter transmembrane domain-containing protein n=1 Tax=Haloechinothrix halophila TaxID=1069073 RepID=UPI0004022185|nr:ABC transporter ATP-binding protein [Haloechinothrix halophila]